VNDPEKSDGEAETTPASQRVVAATGTREPSDPGAERSAEEIDEDVDVPLGVAHRLLRSTHWITWYVVLPLVLASVVVWALTPASGVEPTGPLAWLENLVREQQIPVLIVAVCIFDTAVWAARNQLPFAAQVNPPLRGDLPSSIRPAFERARILLDEAESIRQRRKEAIDRELSPEDRVKLAADLSGLRRAMRRRPFDEERFVDALVRADGEVDVRLGRWRKSEVREYIESIVIAVVVAMGLRAFVIEAFKIPSGSMIPTLQVGDHIFVNKFSYGPAIPFTHLRLWTSMPPERADVMVFQFPEDPDEDFIKRVIALPGDTLEARNGHPIINGWEVPSCLVGVYDYLEVDPREESPLRHEGDLYVEYLGDESYLTFYDRSSGGFAEMQGPFHVKPGEVYVMGDNRNNSRDSRLWWGGAGGGVPFANIRGRALFVWLSVSDGPAGTGPFHFDGSRFGAPVMGTPRLPPDQRRLQPAMEKCLRDRPPIDKTTPPHA
jgi:signal peptidase I